MKHLRIATTLAFVCGLLVLAEAQATELKAPKNAAGAYVLPFTKVHSLRATSNGVRYKLYVRVPAGYAASNKRYPVVYLLDADYSFPLAATVLEHLADRTQVQETIIVGVAYADAYPDRDKYRLFRSRDYTPRFVADAGYGPAFQKESGGAPKFLQFLRQEALPFIDTAYRTDPSDRTLVGHSYGGLFASWTLQQQPEAFSHYLIVSPSLWYDDEMIMKREDVHDLTKLVKKTAVYIAAGANENPVMPRDAIRFSEQLKARTDPNLIVISRVFEDENHSTIFPTAFSTGMRRLHPPQPVSAGAPSP